MSPSNLAHITHSIRWPFRVLAVLIVASCSVALIGGALTAWQGLDHKVDVRNLLLIFPGMAWLLSWAVPAALYGRAPTLTSWPFASNKVLMWYVLVLLFLQWR